MADAVVTPDPNTKGSGNQDQAQAGNTNATPNAGAAAGASATPAEPLYDLKLPQNSIVEQTRISEVVAMAKEKKLTPEQAQAILDTEHSALTRFQESSQKKWKEQQDAWIRQAQQDKEVGGNDFGKNVELANRVIKKYGDAEFTKELDTSGFANHPGLLRLLYRIGKAHSEDTFTVGNAPIKVDTVSPAENLYGKDGVGGR